MFEREGRVDPEVRMKSGWPLTLVKGYAMLCRRPRPQVGRDREQHRAARSEGGELLTKEFDFLHVTPPMSAPDFIRSLGACKVCAQCRAKLMTHVCFAGTAPSQTRLGSSTWTRSRDLTPRPVHWCALYNRVCVPFSTPTCSKDHRGFPVRT